MSLSLGCSSERGDPLPPGPQASMRPQPEVTPLPSFPVPHSGIPVAHASPPRKALPSCTQREARLSLPASQHRGNTCTADLCPAHVTPARPQTPPSAGHVCEPCPIRLFVVFISHASHHAGRSGNVLPMPSPQHSPREEAVCPPLPVDLPDLPGGAGHPSSVHMPPHHGMSPGLQHVASRRPHPPPRGQAGALPYGRVHLELAEGCSEAKSTALVQKESLPRRETRMDAVRCPHRLRK